MSLPRCPMCNGNGESWNGDRRCDNCTFWATDFQWARLAEQAAKSRVLDALLAAEHSHDTPACAACFAKNTNLREAIEREKGTR